MFAVENYLYVTYINYQCSRDMSIGENIRKNLFRLTKGSIYTHVHTIIHRDTCRFTGSSKKRKKELKIKFPREN